MFSARFLLPFVIGSIAVLFALVLLGRVPFNYNLRNLMVRWRTTLLTALAFTLVISLQTVMLAFVEGMTQMTEQSGQPGNVIVLSDGSIDELMSNLGYSDASDIERQPGVLRDANDLPLSSREVYLVVNQLLPSATSQASARRRFTQVRGVDDPQLSGQVHGVALLAGGQWFSGAGVRESGNDELPLIEAVIGEGVADQLAQDRAAPAELTWYQKIPVVGSWFTERAQSLTVGDVFELGPRKWVVTGVMQAAGSTFGSEIWAKRSVVGPMFGKNSYTSFVLRTADAGEAARLSKDLTDNYEKAAVQAQTESEYFSKLNNTNLQFLGAIQFVTIFLAVGGVFGVLNTMLAAVSQRTKDIGVLRIVGFKRWQILVSFFIESLLIALIGGLLGCAIGSLVDGVTASSVISSSQGGGKFVVLQLVVTFETILTGLALALAMGAIGGLLPAMSAMRLKPLESLR